jgi:GNAT superfamily N-acetyltransferase
VIGSFRVLPAREAGWQAVEEVLMSEASARNCWCQFHVLENSAARKTTRTSRRDLLLEQVESLDPPRGLVALDGEKAVGWCGVEPRTRLGHVTASQLVKAASPHPASDTGVWAVYCILVPPQSRGAGVASRLLDAAIEHAREHGAHAIEGYPIDTSKRGGKLPPGFSTGTLPMFEKRGFSPLGSLPSGRTLAHLEIK